MARRVWDRFDEEAEKEGSAYSRQVMTQIIKRGGREGKKIRKQRSGIQAALNRSEMRIMRKYLV
tara:strand:+ start:7211 stop:7402 length:192 start_codon:yes stop_codon:yes gene_type:complete